MRIKIIIRCSPVRPRAQFSRITKLCKQLPCFLGQHRGKVEVGQGELALRCVRCGWKSPGWKLGISAGVGRSNEPAARRAAEILMPPRANHAYPKWR